jgi:preprotein translocase subunit YajC
MKKHEEMIGAVRRGDTIVTSGGLIGKVTKVLDDSGELQVELCEGVRVRIVRTMVSDVRAKGEPAKDDS